MSDSHPFAQAPNSSKPYVRISYYDFQEWQQLVDQEKLSRWEMLRFKLMNERYSIGRAFLQLPLFGLSYLAAHLVIGPPIRRRDAGFRDMLCFSSLFYVLFGQFYDKVKVPDRFLDELLTQNDPNGQYLRTITKQFHPSLWEDLRQQLVDKGVAFEEPEEL